MKKYADDSCEQRLFNNREHIKKKKQSKRCNRSEPAAARYVNV